MEEGLPTVLEQGENSLSHPVTVAQENDDFGGLHESSLSGEDDISKVEDVVTTLMNKVGLGNDKATNAEDKEELEDREVLGLVQAGTGSDIISKGLGVQNDSMGMSGAGRHVDRVDGAPVELLAHSE
ncbi:unnamed protein product [Amaranthus hypochondriacus]